MEPLLARHFPYHDLRLPDMDHLGRLNGRLDLCEGPRSGSWIWAQAKSGASRQGSQQGQRHMQLASRHLEIHRSDKAAFRNWR